MLPPLPSISPRGAGAKSAGSLCTSGAKCCRKKTDILAGLLPQTSVNPVEYLEAAPQREWEEQWSEGRVSGILTARETQIATLAMIEGRRAVAIDGEQLQLQLFLPKDGALAVMTMTGTKLRRAGRSGEAALALGKRPQ